MLATVNAVKYCGTSRDLIKIHSGRQKYFQYILHCTKSLLIWRNFESHVLAHLSLTDVGTLFSTELQFVCKV
jgi:hypothetical protein